MYVCLSVFLSVCESIRSRIWKPHIWTLRIFPYMLITVTVLDRRQCSRLCTSGFIDDVTFSRNEPRGAWRWLYRRGRRATASSHEFPTYSPGAPCCLIFVVYIERQQIAYRGRSLLSTTSSLFVPFSYFQLRSKSWFLVTITYCMQVSVVQRWSSWC